MNASPSLAAVAPPPERYRRWHLYGAGLENVGKNGQPETVELTHPGPDEILVRHDACGICYSDIKIINLGENHPRLAGRDLHENPVVMGHEVALTVVEAGENHKDKFFPGQRFIVQADVFYKGQGLAYGYALPGGMSQYGLIGPEVLEGDEGCYLLPIQDAVGYAAAALVEPWACVEAAYLWTEQSKSDETNDYLCVATMPLGLMLPRLTSINSGHRTVWHGGQSPPPAPNGAGYANIYFLGQTPEPETFEASCALLGKEGVVHLDYCPLPINTKGKFGGFDKPFARPVAVDVGRIHYDGHRYVGKTPHTRNDLKGGGTAWFIGAAGPMGQMHVQRALSLPSPPKKLVCTDRNQERIDALRERFFPLAQERGVELLNFNVRETGTPDLSALAPGGFDDVVVMVPSVEAIEEAWPHMADGGVLNIFAGIARGVTATIDISTVATKNTRIVGTTGSTIADMRHTRDVMESGQLSTNASVAAIGGLNAFRDGLEAVKTGRFPGKTVIFPQVEDFPLTALPDLAVSRPKVAAKLDNGQWTKEAEAALLGEPNGGAA